MNASSIADLIAAAVGSRFPTPTPDYAHELTIRILGWRVLDISFTTRDA